MARFHHLLRVVNSDGDASRASFSDRSDNDADCISPRPSCHGVLSQITIISEID